ncbi:MAG: cupin domain-containing protein [Bacteroidota bacterium]
MNKEEIIKKFDLERHPEGGYFKETYRSKSIATKACLSTDFSGERNFSTAIYYLLTSEAFSAFHRIKQDETWHFYAGNSVLIHMIDAQGNYNHIRLGNDFLKNELPQFVVPANVWFAAEVEQANGFAFVGCTVSPGFDFDDFELAESLDLQQKYPAHQELINRLTR